MSAVTVDGYVVWLAVKVVPVGQRYLSDRKEPEWRVATTTYHFRFFTRLMTPVITSFQLNNAIWQVDWLQRTDLASTSRPRQRKSGRHGESASTQLMDRSDSGGSSTREDLDFS